MRFLEMGLAFAVIGFVVANVAISLLTVAVWRVLRRSELRAGPLFALRMSPALGSAVLVLAVILPAYWFFEPRETSERAGPALAVFAVMAGALLVMGLRRGAKSWSDTRRLERAWTSIAARSTTLPLPIPAYRLPTAAPLAALVGLFRPRLFVSGPFLDSLLANERRAVLDHEAAHVHALDNLKRTAMRLAPDGLAFLAAGREIEAAWAMAAEEEADDRAAGPDGARSLDLAGALIKASRLSPAPCGPVVAFCDESNIVRRVRRLLADRPAPREPAPRLLHRLVFALAALTAVGILAGPGLHAAYTFSEATIRLLNYGAW